MDRVGIQSEQALKRALIECIALTLYPTEVPGYIVHFPFFIY